MVKPVKRVRQVFGNSTDRVLFIFLELSTSRYYLFPGQELLLHYDPEDTRSAHGAPLAVELIRDGGGMQLTVWTGETEMFRPDGQLAERCYDTFEHMQAIHQQKLGVEPD